MSNLKFYFYVFVFFFAFCYFHQVEALEVNNFNYNVPDENKLVNYNNFVTNFIDDSLVIDDHYQDNHTTNLKSPNIFYYYDKVRLEDLSITGSYSFGGPGGSCHESKLLGDNFSLDSYGEGFGNFMGDFGFYLQNGCSTLKFPLKFRTGHNYIALVEIQKSNNLKFFGNSDTINFTDRTFSITGYINGSGNLTYISHDYLDINSIEWVTPNTYNFDKNYAYLLINFSLNDLFSGYFVPNSFEFDVRDYNSEPYKMNTTSSFVFNTDTENHNLKFRSFSLIEDGVIEFNGITCKNGRCHSGTGIYGGMDKVEENDIIVLQDSETCQLTDIACHLRNLKAKFNNLLVRIGNGFRMITQAIFDIVGNIVNPIIEALRNLFIPSGSALSNFFNTNYQLLHNKLGFLVYPFDFIGSFLDSYNNLTRNPVISFNGFTLPGFNTVLIPAFVFNFDDYLYSGNFNTLYNYYIVFADFITLSLFIVLAYKKFTRFFGGGD